MIHSNKKTTKGHNRAWISISFGRTGGRTGGYVTAVANVFLSQVEISTPFRWIGIGTGTEDKLHFFAVEGVRASLLYGRTIPQVWSSIGYTARQRSKLPNHERIESLTRRLLAMNLQKAEARGCCLVCWNFTMLEHRILFN